MKKLRLMDASGDSVIEFDETEAKVSAKAEAEALFERMKDGGASVFTTTGKRVDAFKDLSEDNVIVPRIVGG